MKKALLPLVFLTTLLSCSSSEENVTKSKEILSNYKVSETHLGDEFTHYFDGDKGINQKKQYGENLITFKYNGNKLKEYHTNYSDGDIIQSDYFNYDSENNITSTTQIVGITSNFIDKKFTYNNNSIISEYYDESYDKEYIMEINLNNNGLIDEFSQKDLQSNELIVQFNFSYDENENCIMVLEKTNHKGTIRESTITNTYDDKINPLYEHYKSNYLAFLMIFGKRFTYNGNHIGSIVRNFGRNNVVTTDGIYYVGEFVHSEKGTLNFEYEYNNNDYPTHASIRQEENDELSFTVEYNYK